MPEKRRGVLEDLGACGRIDSRVDPHDARARPRLDGDQQPTASDIERKRTNDNWLALLEPGHDGGREADRRRRLGAHEIDARPGEGAVREVTRRHDAHTANRKVQLERRDRKRLAHVLILRMGPEPGLHRRDQLGALGATKLGLPGDVTLGAAALTVIFGFIHGARGKPRRRA